MCATVFHTHAGMCRQKECQHAVWQCGVSVWQKLRAVNMLPGGPIPAGLRQQLLYNV
jgi:hypothetical protein